MKYLTALGMHMVTYSAHKEPRNVVFYYKVFYLVHFARLKYFISIIYFLFPHQKCESFLKPAIPAALSFQCNTNLQFISTSKRDDD